MKRNKKMTRCFFYLSFITLLILVNLVVAKPLEIHTYNCRYITGGCNTEDTCKGHVYLGAGCSMVCFEYSWAIAPLPGPSLVISGFANCLSNN